jgi:hypothetical protein
MLPESIERQVIKYEENVNQIRIPSAQGLIAASARWVQITTALLGVVGTAGGNGDEILEINIPAGYVFVCSILHYASNEGRSVAVCTVADAQVLGHASQAEVMAFGSDNKGLHALKAEEQPIFVVDNSASAVDIDLLLYAPPTVFNIANNPATSYFQAFMAGILYDGRVAIRGTT